MHYLATIHQTTDKIMTWPATTCASDYSQHIKMQKEHTTLPVGQPQDCCTV